MMRVMVDRPEGLPSCPPDQVSEQRALASGARASFAVVIVVGERFVHPALVGAKLGGDLLLGEALSAQMANRLPFQPAEAGPLDRDVVQQDTRHRVVVSSHGFSFHVAAVVPLSVRVQRLHSQGDSRQRVALQSLVSDTIRRSVHRDMLWIRCGEVAA